MDERRRSGLSLREFARREGFSLARLYRWRRRLAQGSSLGPVRFVEVIAQPSPVGSRGAALEVSTVFGVARLAGNFTIADLAALARELHGRC
jgi:hypothetical protein